VTMAALGDAAGALQEARASLDLVQGSEGKRDVLFHMYLGRALAGNGEVYMILAKRASGGERASDWRLATDFYRRAIAEFETYHPSTEPYLSEVRQAEADLGECERALKAPVSQALH
jgi:hypothetical protein